ncbi:MAG TPA: OsmC family protein [Actinomycetota bacterium]|nr:OsmC family protein [Actinomycetota bacterium]
MTNIEVRYVQGDRLTVAVRGHELTVDQPVGDGGEDLAPTPTELFVSGLAACVGFYAERYLRRHDLDPTGLVVDSDFDFSEDRPSRVSDIRISVTAPSLPESRREPFARVIEHCTVHNSLVRPPTVAMELVRSEKAA